MSRPIPLRSFLFGRFDSAGVGNATRDYQHVLLQPAAARGEFLALQEVLDPLAQLLTETDPASSLHLLVPVPSVRDLPFLFPGRPDAGWIYLRLFADRSRDPGGRRSRRYRVVALDSDEMRALSWRPWRLDRLLVGSSGRLPSWLSEPHNAGCTEGIEPPAFEVAQLEPLPAASTEIHALARRASSHLASGNAVCTCEEPEASALERLASLLQASDREGLALGGIATLANAEARILSLLAGHSVRMACVRVPSNRLPAPWIELGRSVQ